MCNYCYYYSTIISSSVSFIGICIDSGTYPVEEYPWEEMWTSTSRMPKILLDEIHFLRKVVLKKLRVLQFRLSYILDFEKYHDCHECKCYNCYRIDHSYHFSKYNNDNASTKCYYSTSHDRNKIQRILLEYLPCPLMLQPLLWY